MTDNYFQSSDQAFVAYLCCEGFMFLGCKADPTDDHPNQMAYILIDENGNVPKFEELWRTNKAQVNAPYYAKMMRMLNRKKRQYLEEQK